MHSDHRDYFQFSGPARLEKAINSLSGIIEGIAADSVINAIEIEYLQDWLKSHRELEHRHPYNELVPVLQAALADNHLSDEEKTNILWLCKKLRTTEYFDACTSDIQRLHGLLAGIAADHEINSNELSNLRAWLSDHAHLRTCWPYDEIDHLVTSIVTKSTLEQQDHRMLLGVFSEFLNVPAKTITQPPIQESERISGLCAIAPEINFSGSGFSFTGASNRYKRSHLANLITELGGVFLPNVTKETNYLIIGADGNPCWSYACYGRKVEKAVQLRKEGIRLIIIHEHDFHDAVEDMKA